LIGCARVDLWKHMMNLHSPHLMCNVLYVRSDSLNLKNSFSVGTVSGITVRIQ
jgi:hypothetical protein